MQADLTIGFDVFLAILLLKAKRKPHKQVTMLMVEDLTIKYSWWSVKELKQLTAIRDLGTDCDDLEVFLDSVVAS